MQFDQHTPIYLQIANYLYDQILSGAWSDGQRIPSIREMAVQLEVNPNTVMRTYTMLQEEGTLENQRGIGYFIAAGARENVFQKKREEFIRTSLPSFFTTMERLALTLDDIERYYRATRKETGNYETPHEKEQ